MILAGFHEKQLFADSYPFRLADNTQSSFTFPFHWHSAVELVYAVESGCTVNVNSTDYSLSQYDILFIAAGDIHNLQTPAGPGRRVFIQFDISLLDGFGGFDAVKPCLTQSRKITVEETPDLHSELEKEIVWIIREYEKRELAFALSLHARILDVIVILTRHTAVHAPGDPPDRSSKRVTGLEKLNQALKYIDENYSNDITLRAAARAAGFSEYHFSRIFKDVTEKSFLSYLNEVRIRKAEKLLMTENTTIARIAHASGFNSLATFHRAFREVKGCTPSSYRKRKA
jgi:AraC-like DNA-binding protein